MLHTSTAEKAFQRLISKEIKMRSKFHKNKEFYDYRILEDGSESMDTDIRVGKHMRAYFEIVDTPNGDVFIEEIFFIYEKGKVFETFESYNDHVINFVEVLEEAYKNS